MGFNNFEHPDVLLNYAFRDLVELASMYDFLNVSKPLWLRLCIYIIEDHLEDFKESYLLEDNKND